MPDPPTNMTHTASVPASRIRAAMGSGDANVSEMVQVLPHPWFPYFMGAYGPPLVRI